MSVRPVLSHHADLGPTFTVAAGRAAGVSGWQLWRGPLRAPTYGVRSTGPPPDDDDVVGRCRELLPALPADAVFSHATALVLLGVDRPLGLNRPGDLHVEVPGGTRRPRRPGVVGHRRSATGGPILRPEGLPVAPPERVWCQLAAELDPDELVVLGDALLRRSRPCSSLAALGRAVVRLPEGYRGARALHAALPRLRARTDSCPETRLRLTIVAAGLPCPEVNVPVRGPDGVFVALPDLSYPGARIAIEYDGDVHRTDGRTWRRDIARRRALEQLGWRMLTCTADDLRDPRPALLWLRSALPSTTCLTERAENVGSRVPDRHSAPAR